MSPPQLAHGRLDLGAGLVRAVVGPMGPILEPDQPARAIAAHPGVDALARDPIAGRDLGHTPPTQHLPNCVIALLDHTPLPQHPLGLLPTATDTASKQTERSCQASPETIKDLVKPTRPASPEPEHRALEFVVRTFSTNSRPASGRPAAALGRQCQRQAGSRPTVRCQPNGCYCWISTSAAITTQRFKGSAATPIAVRACWPTSSPYRSTISSENPLMTLVVCP